MSSLPIGRWISIPDEFDTNLVTNSMITGSVKRVMMLLNAVSVIDKATLPLANIDKTLEELPPGQHATSTRPIKYIGGNFSTQATTKAMSGSKIICPTMPNSTAFGCLAMSVKAFLFKSIPSRNISMIKMGITIHMVFIILFF
jgi:hypothetical protein